MKVEERLIPLLKKAGILLQGNSRLPPPPVICEEWWEQAERLIRNGTSFRPKYGLGYHDVDPLDDEEELYEKHRVNSCTTSATTKGHYFDLEEAESSDEEGLVSIYPSEHQP
jgi:hypothetical protein